MKIIYNNYIPFKGFKAVNLFGVVFARKSAKPLSEKTLNHERIHTFQMQELLYVGFYLIYFLEWIYLLIRSFWTGENPYREISFEREAYAKQSRKYYLITRKPYAQWRKSK